MITKEQIENASSASMKCRDVIEKSKMAGCFCCGNIFPVDKITEWWDEGKTPVCPECGIDSVLGDASGYPITKEAMEEIKKYAFPPNTMDTLKKIVGEDIGI